MAEPTIRASRLSQAPDAEFGDDVVIEADDVEIGPGARIGFSDGDDFRTPPGVRIQVRRLVLGRGVVIGRSVRIEGGEIRLDDGVRVHRNSTIRVLDVLHIGAGGTVGDGCEISGRQVRIGQELWMLPQAKIGGGSAFEIGSRLDAGHFLHLGLQTFLNTARPVRIGHEVGLGTRTSVYTHGAYPSGLMGFPVAFEGVEIGDFSWLPGAIVNPGVRIGRNCVIGVNSLVTTDIPDGSLAAGSPAKVVRERAYPRPLSDAEQLDFFEAFLRSYSTLLGGDGSIERLEAAVRLETPDATYVAAPRIPEDVAAALDPGRRVLGVAEWGQVPVADAWTAFGTSRRRVTGVSDTAADRLANELRRHGIRFYSRGLNGRYVDWEVEPPRFETEPPLPSTPS
jgi:acetyltransferase-like isoleucine patch superfamily enzyme